MDTKYLFEWIEKNRSPQLVRYLFGGTEMKYLLYQNIYKQKAPTEQLNENKIFV